MSQNSPGTQKEFAVKTCQKAQKVLSHFSNKILQNVLYFDNRKMG